jgi:hypothetical protein
LLWFEGTLCRANTKWVSLIYDNSEPSSGVICSGQIMNISIYGHCLFLYWLKYTRDLPFLGPFGVQSRLWCLPQTIFRDPREQACMKKFKVFHKGIYNPFIHSSPFRTGTVIHADT